MINNDKSLALKQSLDQNKKYQHLLYRRGYVVTTNRQLKTDEYPFYGNWKCKDINDKYVLYIHNDQTSYINHFDNNISIVLVGHAYNPFTGEIDENEILNHAYREYSKSKRDFFDYISELTGIHVIFVFDYSEIIAVQDCTAMEACYYGMCNDNYYYLSHAGILGDIDTPTENAFINKLINSYCYSHWGTKYLPGDLSVYNELSRLGPNVYVSLSDGQFSLHRFYPYKPHPEVDHNNQEVLEEIARLIKASVSLCAEKWDRPAISLSGGLDSRTTFAASSGVFEKFYYYSFYCKQQEKDDAEAAHAICDVFDVDHTIYPITDNNDDIKDFDLFKRIVAHNGAYTHIPGDHEIRKYNYLSTLDDFDTELKSWASEIGRAYWEKRYGFSLPDRLTPLDFSIFQTRFIGAPILLKKSKMAYQEYLKKTELLKPPYNYDHTDFFYWEYRFGSNGTNVTMEQQIFNFDVTMPMNNRKLMDMFLWFPHDFRKEDGVNNATILINEPRFVDIHNDVHNGYFAGRRIKAEGLYYKFMKRMHFESLGKKK